MERKSLFSLHARVESFAQAFNGLKLFFRLEHNAWIHLIITCMVTTFALLLEFDYQEWFWLILVIVGVFSAEILNSAIEKLADIVEPEYDPKIKVVKDMAAAAVLMVSIGAAAIGLLLFVPKLFERFCSL